ncbi:reverse transcriptase domain-containing protein [Nocardia nova]|uniref:reverse transcriptase domain-containing protein n=1 Tax=Nocardia nova TaxID=37330 RepID=UPI002351D1FA|nr:reverse transcriptase domain-containing protein [Nocardia nova]
MHKWLSSSIQRSGWGGRADTVFADKGAKGSRPLSVMSLQDRVVYRALVARLEGLLPDELRQREPFSDFSSAPTRVQSARYVTSMDVSSYYVYVDHDLLVDELTAQTGDALTVGALTELLHKVMGRRIGLPQVSSVSDTLGDTHLDRVRRRLVRKGFTVSRYADDFRVVSDSLGSARQAVEECATELYTLGLVLNDEKTLTYGINTYRTSLKRFATAERELFVDDDHGDDELRTLMRGGYLDDHFDLEGAASENDGEIDDETDGSPPTLGDAPASSGIDDIEAIQSDTVDVTRELTEAQTQAAHRAWDIWTMRESRSRRDSAVIRTLLHRALPILGAAGDTVPLSSLLRVVSTEPGLTPQLAQYFGALPEKEQRQKARAALDELLSDDSPPLSTWQKMWIAHSIGEMKRLRQRPGSSQRRYMEWLIECLASEHPGLVATAAASLGKIRAGETEMLAAAFDRVGPQWRSLVLWGLARLDMTKAQSCADSALDRIMLENM